MLGQDGFKEVPVGSKILSKENVMNISKFFKKISRCFKEVSSGFQGYFEGVS